MKWIVMILVLAALGATAWFALGPGDSRPMHEQVGDVAVSQDRWIQGDWERARTRAKEEGKPVLALFRCVP